MPRVLLTSVYQPFCVDDPLDSPDNHVQHGSTHRQFTREQGIFTILQQCSHLALHLMAANIDARTEVLEYPTLEQFRQRVQQAAARGVPYDYIGVTCVVSNARKARRMCQLAKQDSPTSVTVVGGGGVLALGGLVPTFADHVCRGDGVAFMRRLLGQDPEAQVEHPPVWSVHFPNRIFGYESNDAAYSLAVSLGCHRRCDFCATSAQFDGQRVPLLRSAEEVLAAMQRVDREHTATRGKAGALHFVMFDENFLSQPELAHEFLRLNREQLCRGRLYLPLLFADATAVRRFTPEQLLEMGVDALWIGMECADSARYAKNRDVDFRRLVTELQGHGIKVLISFIAGLEQQTRASIQQDMDFALSLGAVGYQYAMACPMPGTVAYEELERAGKLDVQRPEQINMSHYYIRHPELSAGEVRGFTDGFQQQDYLRNGPFALRYMKLRLAGLRRHRRAGRPALRARARGFANDLMFSVPGAAVGKVLGPTPELRKEFARIQRTIRREVGLPRTLLNLALGRTSSAAALRLVLFTHPLTEPLARWWVIAHALRWDPRTATQCRGLLGLLRHGRQSVRTVRRGMMPWSQPEPVLTRYPRSAP